MEQVQGPHALRSTVEWLGALGYTCFYQDYHGHLARASAPTLDAIQAMVDDGACDGAPLWRWHIVDDSRPARFFTSFDRSLSLTHYFHYYQVCTGIT